MLLRSPRFTRPFGLITIGLVLCLTLAACGSSGSAADPTPTISATEGPAPTLAPGQTSVGDVLAKIDAATKSVTTTRKVEWSSAGDGAIGTPSADDTVTTEDTVAPASRHVTVTQGGQTTDEQIAINGKTYFKGSFVQSAIAPFAAATDWVEVDPAIAEPETPVGETIAYLTGPLLPVYGDVTDDLKARAATPSGSILVQGRECNVFTFVDSTDTGTKITYALSIDAQNLPCSLVQTAGGYMDTTLYSFNVSGLAIAAPAVSTPVSGTPEG